MYIGHIQAQIVNSECNLSAETVNTIGAFDRNIFPLLPYLASAVKPFMYNPQGRTLSIKLEGRLVTFHPDRVTVTKLKDADEALVFIEKIRRLLNEVYDRRESISPALHEVSPPNPLLILRALPKDNCGRCGEPTCMAFSIKVRNSERDVRECIPVFESDDENKKRALLRVVEEDHGSAG